MTSALCVSVAVLFAGCFCYLHVPPEAITSDADGMAVDTRGNLYVSTTPPAPHL